MADSYLQASAHSALGSADIAATRKEAKYSCLPPSYSFQVASSLVMLPTSSNAEIFRARSCIFLVVVVVTFFNHNFVDCKVTKPLAKPRKKCYSLGNDCGQCGCVHQMHCECDSSVCSRSRTHTRVRVFFVYHRPTLILSNV